MDLAENYNNLQHVKQALSQALAPLLEGGLGIERKDIWITMKIPVTSSINNINALLLPPPPPPLLHHHDHTIFKY